MSSKASSPLSSLSRSPSPPPPKDDVENSGVVAEDAKPVGSPKETPPDALPKADQSADDENEGEDNGNDTDEDEGEDEDDSLVPSTEKSDARETQVTSQPAATNAHVSGDWQAVWSAPHNSYYFHNMRTGETTWENPLAEGDTSAIAGPSSHYDAAAAAAEAQGIDPGLAYLDPSLAAGPSNPAAFTYAAKFNARTGAFAKPDARNPEHVSEYERMKRMSGFYFDMDAWQDEVDQRHADEEENGKKRKKPTKKDVVRSSPYNAQAAYLYCTQETYKERKKQKKLAKTAWLRT